MSKKTRTRFVLLSLMAVLLASASAVVPVEAAPRPDYCKFVLCAYPDCLPNEHTEIPPGGCCPVCVPN